MQDKPELNTRSFRVLDELVHFIDRLLIGYDNKPAVDVSVVTDRAATACIESVSRAAFVVVTPAKGGKKLAEAPVDNGEAVIRAYLNYVATEQVRDRTRNIRTAPAVLLSHPAFMALHDEILRPKGSTPEAKADKQVDDPNNWGPLVRGKRSFIEFSMAQAQWGWGRTKSALVAVGFLSALLFPDNRNREHPAKLALNKAYEELVRRCQQYNYDYLRLALMEGSPEVLAKARAMVYHESFAFGMEVSTFMTGERYRMQAYNTAEETKFRKELAAAAGVQP